MRGCLIWLMSRDLEDLDERSQTLLRLLVELYLESGTPVASKRLASDPSVAVSSATVRNIMAELEERGLVASPHTSAGRVPTSRGLRFFVDTLISVRPLDAESVERLRGELNPDLAPKELVESASQLLSEITHMAGLVMLPRREVNALRHVEFLRLEGRRVLVILVLNEREVQNRVIHTDRDYTDAELSQAAHFILRHFVGQPLSDIRRAVVDSMQADRERLDSMMQTAIDVAGKAFEDPAGEADDYVLAGEANLLDSGDLEGMRALFEAFNRKRDILHLLDRCLETHGVQLFIGQETGHELFDEYSLVTAPYEVDGKLAGALGVIGPTRMAYQRVIPVVDATARLLGAAMRY